MTHGAMNVNELWHSRDERVWAEALDRYWGLIKPADLSLVRELEPLNVNAVRQLAPREWYDFLHEKYFRWKYTAPNRLATTRKALRTYVETETLDDLYRIKQELFDFDIQDIAAGLRIASSIRGLGIAGASGLLALLYPTGFATVDQFVVKALRDVEGLTEHQLLERMNPEGLKPSDGAVLIRIMRAKAVELNRLFGTDVWMPKKIDEILWTYGR